MTAPAERAAPAWRRYLRTVGSLVVVGVLVFWGLPQIADASEVWAAITDMSWAEIASLVVAAGWNIATYAFVMMAVLPGLTFTQAFVVGQSSTAVAASMPAGSALGIGVTYSMYSSWGRGGPEIALAAVLTGIWNVFVKLALPIAALALLALEGSPSSGESAAAVTGVVVLIVAVAVFALILRSEDLANRLGRWFGQLANAARRLLRKSPVVGWGDGLVRFRAGAIGLLSARWQRLTAVTVVSHLSLYIVLLLALRHMDVDATQVSWIEALGAFGLVRFLTALPITPGGLGVVELGLVAALVVAGGDRAPVVAAVLVFRFLTLVVQVPIGALSYAGWRLSLRRAAARAQRRISRVPA